MGASISKKTAQVGVESTGHAPVTVDTQVPSDASSGGGVAVTVAAAAGPPRVVTAGPRMGPRISMPVTRHEHAQMRQQAPPVWDPRSPTAARTPKREIRNIRKSVVIQEQLQQQIQEVKEREEKELRDARLMQQDPRQARGNRRTTEVASLPSRSERTRDERLASSTPKAAAAVSADAGAPVASTGVGAGATAPSTVPSGQRPPASTFALAKDHESVDENPSGMRSPLSAFVGQQLLAGVRDDVTTKTATASASTNASPALAVGQTAPLQPFPLSSVSRATLPPLKPLMELQAIPEGE